MEPFISKEKEQKDLATHFVPFGNPAKGTTFSERLQEVIGNKSGRAFAKEIGISYSTLHNYLTGTSSPTLDNLISLAEHSGVDLNWLATGKGTQFPITKEQIKEKDSKAQKINSVYYSNDLIQENIVCVDKTIFLSSIETLEEILEMTKKTLQPSGKAEIIWAIYELLSKDDNRDSVVKLVRLVV